MQSLVVQAMFAELWQRTGKHSNESSQKQFPL